MRSYTTCDGASPHQLRRRGSRAPRYYKSHLYTFTGVVEPWSNHNFLLQYGRAVCPVEVCAEVCAAEAL